MKSVCLAFTIGLVASSQIALAGTPISETRDVNADARIDVSNVRGSVDINAWDENRVSITGTLGNGSKGLMVEGDAARLSIKVKGNSDSGWFHWGSDSQMEDSNLVIRVPRAAELAIETVSADINASGTSGRSLTVDTVSGKVRLDTQAKSLEIDSVSGDVEVTGAGDRAEIETVSGDVNLRADLAELSLETISGDITAASQNWRTFSGSTVSGSIDLRGTPQPGARFEADSMSGDVNLRLPASVSTRIHVETFSGSIRSDFGTVAEPKRGPGSSLDTTEGSGDGSVRIETFSGDVSIRREGT